MSGFTDDAIVRHGVLDDEVFFIQKPFSPDALALKARAVLDYLPGATPSVNLKDSLPPQLGETDHGHPPIN
jgi:hypothetical protein